MPSLQSCLKKKKKNQPHQIFIPVCKPKGSAKISAKLSDFGQLTYIPAQTAFHKQCPPLHDKDMEVKV